MSEASRLPLRAPSFDSGSAICSHNNKVLGQGFQHNAKKRCGVPTKIFDAP